MSKPRMVETQPPVSEKSALTNLATLSGENVPVPSQEAQAAELRALLGLPAEAVAPPVTVSTQAIEGRPPQLDPWAQIEGSQPPAPLRAEDLASLSGESSEPIAIPVMDKATLAQASSLSGEGVAVPSREQQEAEVRALLGVEPSVGSQPHATLDSSIDPWQPVEGNQPPAPLKAEELASLGAPTIDSTPKQSQADSPVEATNVIEEGVADYEPASAPITQDETQPSRASRTVSTTQPKANYTAMGGQQTTIRVASVRAGEDQAAMAHIQSLAEHQRQESKQEQGQSWWKKAIRGFVQENVLKKVADNAARTKAWGAFQFIQEKGFGFVSQDTLLAAEAEARQRIADRGEKVGFWRHLRTKGDSLNTEMMKVLEDWTQQTDPTADGYQRLRDDQLKTWAELDAIAQALTPETLHTQVGEMIASQLKLTGDKAAVLQGKLIDSAQHIIKHEYEKQRGGNADVWADATQVRLDLNTWFQSADPGGFLELLEPAQRAKFLESATFASDVFRLFDQLKGELLPQALAVADHQGGLARIDEKVAESLGAIDTIVVGTKHYGTRTKERKGEQTEGGLYDRLDNLGSNRRKINEALLDWQHVNGDLAEVTSDRVLNTVMGVAGNELLLTGLVSAGGFLAERSLRTAATVASAGIAGGGIIGALKGGRQAERHMYQMESQQAMGFENPDAKLRQMYGEYAVDKRDVRDMKLNIMGLLYEKDGDDLFVVENGAYKERKIQSVEDATKLATWLGEVEARRTLELKHGIDLFKVTDRRQGRYMEEISDIDVLLAQGKVKLRRDLASQPDLNRDFNNHLGVEDFRHAIDSLKAVFEINLESGWSLNEDFRQRLGDSFTPEELDALFVGDKTVAMDPDRSQGMVDKLRSWWTGVETSNRSIQSRLECQRRLKNFEMAKAGTVVGGIGLAVVGAEVGAQAVSQSGLGQMVAGYANQAIEAMNQYLYGVEQHVVPTGLFTELRSTASDHMLATPQVGDHQVVVDAKEGIWVASTTDGHVEQVVFDPKAGESVLSSNGKLTESALKAVHEAKLGIESQGIFDATHGGKLVEFQGAAVKLPPGVELQQNTLVAYVRGEQNPVRVPNVTSLAELKQRLELMGFTANEQVQKGSVTTIFDTGNLREAVVRLKGDEVPFKIPDHTELVMKNGELNLVVADPSHPDLDGKTILEDIKLNDQHHVTNGTELTKQAAAKGYQVVFGENATNEVVQTVKPHSVSYEGFAKEYADHSASVQRGHALFGRTPGAPGAANEAVRYGTDQHDTPAELALKWGGDKTHFDTDGNVVDGRGIGLNGHYQMVQEAKHAYQEVNGQVYEVDIQEAAKEGRVFLGIAADGKEFSHDPRNLIIVEGEWKNGMVVYDIDPKTHPAGQFFEKVGVGDGANAVFKGGCSAQTMIIPKSAGLTAHELATSNKTVAVDIAATYRVPGNPEAMHFEIPGKEEIRKVLTPVIEVKDLVKETPAVHEMTFTGTPTVTQLTPPPPVIYEPEPVPVGGNSEFWIAPLTAWSGRQLERVEGKEAEVEFSEYQEYSEYPEYAEYPEYSEYSEYPEYTDYPEYSEYSEYPEYTEYPEYSEYPEYLDQPEFSEYIPVYEQVFNSLGLTPEERQELRKQPPQERLKRLFEKKGLVPPQDSTPAEQLAAFLKEIHPEYVEVVSEYQEYNDQTPESTRIVPIYEEVFNKLNIPSEHLQVLRQMPPAERVQELYERAGVAEYNEQKDPAQELVRLSYQISPEYGAVMADYSENFQDYAEVSTLEYEAVSDNSRERVKPVRLKTFERLKPVSEVLRKDPETQLNSTQELDRYWALHSKEYAAELKALDEQIGEPMSDTCKMAICIPAYKEDKNIYRTLESYLNQRGLKLDEIEVIVLDNHKESTPSDNTELEVKRFQSEHPELPVRYAHVVFPGDKTPPLGIIRKVSLDLALQRHQNRQNPRPDFLLATNDGDAYGFRPTAFKHLFEVFADSKIDLIQGKVDYPEEVYKKYPTLHVVRRFEQFIKRALESQKIKAKGEPWQATAYATSQCTFFRPEVYAAVGGWDSDIVRGSDVNFVRRVSEARQFATRHSNALGQVRLYSDPRRALDKMIKGQHHVHQYDEVHWQESTVAGTRWQDYRLPFLETFNRQYLQESINEWLTVRTKGNLEKNPSALRALRRAMDFLGQVEYKIENNQVVLTDTSVLEQRLKAYQESDSRSIEPVAFFDMEPVTSVSETLKKNPEAALNEKEEIDAYLQKQSGEYLEQLKTLNNQISIPMSKNCKVVVGIPSYNEEKNIEQVLESYANQSGINSGELEVIVFDNHREGAEFDQTEKVVREFQHKNPQIAIHYIKGITPSNGTVGFCRKVLADLSLLRLQDRLDTFTDQTVSELLLFTADGDTLPKIDAMQNLTQLFDSDSMLDMIGGEVNYRLGALLTFPALEAIDTFEKTMRRLRRDAYKRRTGKEWDLRTPGCNSAIRAKSYAAIGGFDPSKIRKPAEDTELGQRLKRTRNNKEEYIKYASNVVVYTDPRRGLVKMADGRTLAQIFEDNDWQEETRTIGKGWQDFKLPELETFSKAGFQREIDGWLNFRRAQVQRQGQEISKYLEGLKPFFDQTAKTMGFTYHLEGDRIVIDDTAELEKNLTKPVVTEIKNES